MKLSNKNEVLSMTTTAQKWGNSIGVRIPKTIAEKLEIVNGSPIRISENDGSIIIRPTTDDPTLEELLAKCTPENRHEEIDWGKPEGNEIW